VPFLDHRVVELAFRMPGAVKYAGDVPKAVLRRAMRGVVPDAVLDRTDKRGFETPATLWLRQGHAAAVRELVTAGAAVRRGILDRRAARDVVEAFLAGQRGPEHEIWRLVNLELWLRAFFDERAGALEAA